MALKNNGIIVVKENVTNSNSSILEIDKTDSSVTRSINSLRSLFEKAGLICIKEKQQIKFPRGLYPVYMFALRPMSCQTELVNKV